MAYIRDEKRTTNRRYKSKGREPMSTEELAAEFDRFISAIKAEAWDEGANGAAASLGRRTHYFFNPYRDEATP